MIVWLYLFQEKGPPYFKNFGHTSSWELSSVYLQSWSLMCFLNLDPFSLYLSQSTVLKFLVKWREIFEQSLMLHLVHLKSCNQTIYIALPTSSVALKITSKHNFPDIFYDNYSMMTIWLHHFLITDGASIFWKRLWLLIMESIFCVAFDKSTKLT